MESTNNHPTIEIVKESLGNIQLRTTSFRGDTTLIADPKDVHRLLRFLRDDPSCNYDLLCDVTAVDYLDYPTATIGRFAVVWILANTDLAMRICVKTFLNPSMDTSGIEDDPALYIDSSTDIWEGAEWREREIFDMFGIRFRNHPDLRRILMWKDFPAHPLRKDYPLQGRGERTNLPIVSRDDA
ncbi:MAG: NADH-quinone oxidoreductase subunit C [Phycisphaerales bacterium]|jgi:NADH-quinone oxidoreductase subunit C|nr:NADH-quinone oxidoreductase subunit C [Phycisphaerales bacterium]